MELNQLNRFSTGSQKIKRGLVFTSRNQRKNKHLRDDSKSIKGDQSETRKQHDIKGKQILRRQAKSEEKVFRSHERMKAVDRTLPEENRL